MSSIKADHITGQQPAHQGRQGNVAGSEKAARNLSRDPELPAATKTIQRELELETNQH